MHNVVNRCCPWPDDNGGHFGSEGALFVMQRSTFQQRLLLHTTRHKIQLNHKPE
jgi:hypothetical protein